ncbi:hypothetical protein [Tistrella mobilis]|uniref:hypothetical protein n=1 Tax=Tistrella mobilis TaxID=171437 RepID=UPI00355806C9
MNNGDDFINRMYLWSKRLFLASPENIGQAILSIKAPTRWHFFEDRDLSVTFKDILAFEGIPDYGGAVRNSLKRLMIKGTIREEEVNFDDITGVWTSKGHLIGNLPRLIYTSDVVSKIEPTDKNFDSVLRGVWKESGCVTDGRFNLYEESWSGRLIAANGGAARRIAWLHKYSYIKKSPIPARITPLHIEPEALKILTRRYWVALLPGYNSALTLVSQLKRMGIRGVEDIGKANSAGNEQGDALTAWSIFSCDRDCPQYRDIRLGLLDSPLPVFDFSQWLMQIAAGRRNP